jgi:hypothetical protein
VTAQLPDINDSSVVFRNRTAAHSTAAGRSRRGFGDAEIAQDQPMAVGSWGPASCPSQRFDLEASEINQAIDPGSAVTQEDPVAIVVRKLKMAERSLQSVGAFILT